MRNLDTAADERGDAFAPTHWSVVLAAGANDADLEEAQAALARLCETYWPPLYSYARGRGYSTHDAEDLTQGFFAHLVENRIYARTDPAKGKFRAFLLASFKNFLSQGRARESALKRGGGRVFVSLEESRAEAAESLFQSHDAAESHPVMDDHLFERTWAETLVATVLERVGAIYRAEAKERLFEDLKSFVTVGTNHVPSYTELAMRLGLEESSIRSQVTRLRARYREILRAEVRRTVESEAEVDGELRELLHILSAS